MFNSNDPFRSVWEWSGLIVRNHFVFQLFVFWVIYLFLVGQCDVLYTWESFSFHLVESSIFSSSGRCDKKVLCTCIYTHQSAITLNPLTLKPTQFGVLLCHWGSSSQFEGGSTGPLGVCCAAWTRMFAANPSGAAGYPWLGDPWIRHFFCLVHPMDVQSD